MEDGQSKVSTAMLAIIFLASLIDGLDVSIVTVSLPTMAEYFGVSPEDSSWVIFAYVLGLAAFLLPMGKMAKNGRMKKFMILGTALFGVSSLACGLSEHFWVLILFRLLQGLSAAMMSSVLPSMVVHMLPADRKGLGMSVMGASSGLALILGPVLGGAITGFLEWRWLFFINVPICLVIIFMAMKQMPRDWQPDPMKDPSPVGGISAMLVIGSLLTILEDLGDPDINLKGRIICGTIAIIAIPVLYWSIKRDSARAIIQPKVVMNKEYMIIGTAFLLCTIVVSGAQYLLPYILQGLWDMSPLRFRFFICLSS